PARAVPQAGGTPQEPEAGVGTPARRVGRRGRTVVLHAVHRRAQGVLLRPPRRDLSDRGLRQPENAGSLCLTAARARLIRMSPHGMKQLAIVVRPFRAEAVLKAIAGLNVVSCVVREAKGYSRQKGYLDRYLGSEYSMAFLPKVEIIVSVADDRAEEVADRIVRAARTGRIGDGKVFVLSAAWPDALEF